MDNLVDVSIDDLALIENLSLRALNICHDNSLMTLRQILVFYRIKKSFLTLRNSGAKTNTELINLCLRYNNYMPEEAVISESKNTEINIAKFNSLSAIQKSILNKYYEHSISKLSARSYNGLGSMADVTNLKEIFNIILPENFHFKFIRNIGDKTLAELEEFKKDIINFINNLYSMPIHQIGKEYAKLIIQTSFPNLPESIEAHAEKIFDEADKIKSFSLIKFLIDCGHIFNKVENRIFELLYTQNDLVDKNLSSIAKSINLSKERLRQVKVKLTNKIQNSFLFLNKFNPDDFVGYNINISNVYQILDETLAKKINYNENVNFNFKFYSIVFGVIFKKTHSILGDKELSKDKTKTSHSRKYKNHYLINSLLFDCFDFEAFIDDVYLKLNEKTSETYSIQFQGYLYNFIIDDGKLYNNEIIDVCKSILYNEFELVVTSDGYIVFESKINKPVHQYLYEILEGRGSAMTISEITKTANERFPFLALKDGNTRSRLNREKLLFIFFGRSSTYGLRKWEKEKENIKGGTIRDMVYEFLLKEDSPKHITEIVNYVNKYRKTNERSVLTNLKVDESKRFKFFSNSIVGLMSKLYKEEKFVKRQILKKWDEKFSDLKLFHEQNNRWPSLYATDDNERELFRFGYREKIAFQTGKLDKAKEDFLKGIDFPFDENLSIANEWDILANKLFDFVIAHQRMPNSDIKSEKVLYRFCCSNKKAYQNIRMIDRLK